MSSCGGKGHGKNPYSEKQTRKYSEEIKNLVTPPPAFHLDWYAIDKGICLPLTHASWSHCHRSPSLQTYAVSHPCKFFLSEKRYNSITGASLVISATRLTQSHQPASRSYACASQTTQFKDFSTQRCVPSKLKTMYIWWGGVEIGAPRTNRL